MPEQIHQERHQSSPAGLVIRPDPCSVVTVEILVEQNVVEPMRIGLKLFCAAIYGPAPMLVTKEDLSQPLDDLLSHLEEVHEASGPGRTFDFEIVAVVLVKAQQRPNDQSVNRKPDWTTPVRVAAK